MGYEPSRLAMSGSKERALLPIPCSRTTGMGPRSRNEVGQALSGALHDCSHLMSEPNQRKARGM